MRPIMLKFNNDRQNQYRTMTGIYLDGEERIVVKKALTEEAKLHVKHLVDNYNIIKKIYPSYHICKPEFRDDEVLFEYLKGKTFSRYYERAIEADDKESFLRILHEHEKMILSCVDENYCIFEESDDYNKIFGRGDAFAGQRALKKSNFEFTAHNILVDGNTTGLIDYEYVFTFPVPLSLILYHCVYKTNTWTVAGFQEYCSEEEILKELKLFAYKEELEKAWLSFDDYFGKSKMAEAKQRYLKPVQRIDDLCTNYQKLCEEVKGNNNYISILTNNLNEQQRYIATQQNEIEQLKELVSTYKTSLDIKNQELSIREGEIAHQEALLKIKEYDMKKTQEEVLTIKRKSDEKDEENEQLKMQLESKNTELSSIKQSVSWKVTAPIRGIIDLFLSLS